MKKNFAKSKKNQQKKNEKIFIRVMCVLLVLIMVLGLAETLFGGSNSGTTYTITEDGHVHAADGTHIGTVDELFGTDGTVVTEDGHIHAEDGTHLGTVEDDGHEDTEDENTEGTTTEGETTGAAE